MAKNQKGVVASNNLIDISVYISEYGLQHITTGDILIKAMEKGGRSNIEYDIAFGR